MKHLRVKIEKLNISNKRKKTRNNKEKQLLHLI